MDYEITVRVSAEDKVIEIPWEDIEKDFEEFISEKADPTTRRANLTVFRVIESRIRCVFLDRYKKYLIQ